MVRAAAVEQPVELVGSAQRQPRLLKLALAKQTLRPQTDWPSSRDEKLRRQPH